VGTLRRVPAGSASTLRRPLAAALGLSAAKACTFSVLSASCGVPATDGSEGIEKYRIVMLSLAAPSPKAQATSKSPAAPMPPPMHMVTCEGALKARRRGGTGVHGKRAPSETS